MPLGPLQRTVKLSVPTLSAAKVTLLGRSGTVRYTAVVFSLS